MSLQQQQIINELHKPARKNFPRRRTIIKSLHELLQGDLAEFIPFDRTNKGYKYILVVIDTFSKFLWTRPLKSKTGKEVTKAMEEILKDIGSPKPKNLQTDNGTEFYNKHFSQLMQKFNIRHYSTFSIKKAAIVERVIRTLKSKLYKAFSLRGKYKWYDILPKLTLEYNETKHSTIKMKPVDVTPNTRLKVFSQLKIAPKNRYNVGDIVRISKYKGVFSKGFTPNWSNELFKISKVQFTNPVTYLLTDLTDTPIAGGFYEFELLKTSHPDVYLVEKILRRKKDKVYVKWLGFQRPSWIARTDIL